MSSHPIALAILAILIAGTAYRVLVGPTIWDKLLGVGLIASKVMMSAVLLTLVFRESYILDVALIFAVIGFLAQVLIARYIERRGDV